MAKQDLWKKKEEELGVKLSAGDIFRAETAMQSPSVRELTPKEIIQSDFKPIEGISAADSVRIGLNVSDWKNEIKTTRAPAAVSALIPNEVQKTPGRAMAFFTPAKAKGVFREKDKAALEHAQEMVDTYSKLRGSYTTSREEKQEANRQVQYFQGEVDRLTDKLYGEEIAKLESQKETYKAEYEAAKAEKEKSDKYVYGKLNSGQPLTAAEKAEREKVLERFEKAKENYVPGGWFQGAFQQVGGAFANVLPTAVELGNEAKRADAKPLSPVDTGDPEMDAYLAQIGGAADKAVARPEGALLDDKEIQSWQQKADELTERGQYRIEMSKAGTSKAEQTLIDIGVGATQRLGDIALGTATGVGVMPVMAIRSFGGGAQEARQNGANVQQQFLYGIASAGVEVITEKIFGGPQFFQKAYGAGFLDNVVNKLTKKLTTKSGQVTWLTAKSFLEEGSEEFIASIVNPFISTIYKEDALKEAYGNGDAFLTTVTNALYDALIGGVLGFAGFAVNAKGEMRNLQQQVAMAELEKMVSIDKLGQEFGGEVSLMVKALTESQTYAEGTASRTLGRDLREALYELIDANDSAGVRNFFKANKAQFDKLLKVMTLESDKIVPAEQDPRRNGTLGELATQSEETQSEDSYSRVMDSTETKVYEALTAKGFSSGEATAVFEYVARIVDGDITLTNNDITERARVGKDPRIIEVINELTGSNLNVNEKSRSKVKAEVRDVIAKVAAAKEDARIAEAQQSAVADVEQMVAETRASIPLEQVFTPAQQASPAAAPTVEPTAAEQSGADKFMAFAKGDAEAEIQPQSEYTEDWLEDENIKQVLREQGVTDDEARALLRNYEAGARAAGVDPVADFSSFIRYSVDEQVENYVNVGNITDEQKLARDILKASLADLGIKDVVLVTGDARMVGSNGSYVGGVVTINADRINTQTYSGIAWTVGHEIVHAAEDADGGRKANGVTVRNAKIVNDIFDVMRVLADAGAIEGRYAEITRDEKSLAALIDKKKDVEHRFLMRDWVDENGVFHKGMTKQEAERSFNDFDARAEIAADFLGSMLGHNFKHEREGRFGSKFGTSDIFAMMEETAPETTSWIQEKLNSIRDRLRGYDAKTAAERKAKATMQRHLTKLSKELAEAISKGTQTNTAEMRNSIVEITKAAGMQAHKDSVGRVTFTIDGVAVSEVTPEHIRDNSGIGALIKYAESADNITAEEAEEQFKAAAEIMNMIMKTQDPDMVWAWVGSSLFSAVKANADGQYGTTIDFTTVCRKTQDMITAMSRAMTRLNRGLTKDEVVNLQREVFNEGGTVPCPVCYVFSRWAGIGSILDNMYRWQQKYKSYTNEQLQRRIDELSEKVDAGKKPLEEMLREQDDTYDALEQENESLKKEKKELETKRKAAVKAKDNVAVSEIDARLKDIEKRLPAIAKQQKEIRDSVAPELSWLENVRTHPEYAEKGEVPPKVLFNLEDAATFASRYSVAWGYRNSRGPSAGKAILPYSDMRLGDFILGVKNTSADGNVLFQDVDGNFTDDQLAAVEKAEARVSAQNLIGGQRFQSTSDFRYDYALDYLMAFWELQAVGSKLQTYTKIIEYADMIAAIRGDVNLSVMPLNKGYVVESDGTHRLIFSSVTGINYDAAVKSNAMHDNVQLILVGINDEHILAALEDSEATRGNTIGFVIPYHASGASINEFIRGLVANLGETFDVSYYKDYSKAQSDKVRDNATPEQLRRKDLREKLLKGKDGAKSWKPKAEDLAFINGESVSIEGRSFEELREIELAALAGDTSAIAEYESWTRGNLRQLYEKLWTDTSSEYYNTRLNSAQAKSVMPHEYWNKDVGRSEAYINGFLFRSYCYNLGLIPRFSGITTKEETYGDFTNSPGYWKTLIDRPMYNNDGTYREQERVNVSSFKPEMLTPEYAERNWKGYNVKEPDAVVARRAADRFVDENRFSVDDSDGNALSAGQQEYFKDSKVRDEGGRLKVMYHGTQSFGFSIFDPSYSDDGRSLFFTDSAYTAESYSGTLRDRSLLVDELDPYEASIEEVVDKYNEIFHENAKVLSTPEVMERAEKLVESNHENARTVVGLIEKLDAWLELAMITDENVVRRARDAAKLFEVPYRAMARAKGRDNLNRAAELMEMVANSEEGQFEYDNPFFQLLPRDGWPIVLAQNAREAARAVGWSEGGNRVVRNHGSLVSSDGIRAALAREMSDKYVGNYKVYLNITNPLEINANGAAWDEILVPKPIRDDFISSSPRGEYLRGAVEQLKGQIAEWEAELAVAEEAQKTFVRDQIDYVTQELNAVYGELDSLKYTTTRELAEYAQRKGYDGVLINDVFDMGEELYNEEYSNIAIAFSSEQVKDIYNTDPTTDPDIRYSVDDTAYMEAVEAGDMDTAQRMVDEAAKERLSESKIRDRDGNLLVVFHATEADFTVFDKKKINGWNSFGNGFYFTPSSSLAKDYGSKIGAYFLDIKNPVDYYAVDKPLWVDMLERSGYDYDKEFVESYDEDALWDADLIDDFFGGALKGVNLYDAFADIVQKAGYDGIIAGDEIIAFDSNQIKSADPVTYDDNGNVIPLSQRFNSDNPDIRYSVDDSVATDEESKAVIRRLKTDAMYAKYSNELAPMTPERFKSVYQDSMAKGSPDYAKSYIAWVSPFDYIYATTTSRQSRDTLSEEAGELDLERLQGYEMPIWLSVNMETGEIIGHEGRHRMLALEKAGVEKVAIVIKAMNTDRTSSKPISRMRLTGQSFLELFPGYTPKGADFTLHDALPLSERYGETAYQLFAANPKEGFIRYSVDDTTEAPVKEAEAPTEPELTPQQIRGRDRAEAIRRVFTAAREMYGDDFVKKMSEDTNTKAGIERLNQVFRPAADQARAEQRTRDDLRLQREREREAKRRREMRKAFNLEKQDIRKEEREKARIDKMAALAVQEQKLDDKWKARMEAKADKVKAQAEERLRIKMRKADFIRAYENLAAEIREKKAKAEGKRKAAEERRRGNERISEQRVLSRTTAKEARRVLSQSRNTDRPDYTNSEVETLRQLRPNDVSTEQVTTLADKLRNARKRLYRVFVNQAQTIDNFSKLQIDGIRAGSLVNMIFGSASTIETIYQNGLVARDGTRLGDAMKEVFLVRNADGSIDQEKQAILQDYMLFVHNIDRMSFSERALARVEAMEAQHPWLVDIGAKEFAYAAGLNDAETEATGTEERRAIVREYAAALKALNEAKDKPIFADKDGKPISAETSREIVARYEEEHPWVKEKAEGIYEWWDSFMREWAVGNTLSAEAYDTWKQMYPHYVPTYRMNEGGPDGAIQIGPVSASINDLYKAAKGSTKPVKNIEESFSTLVRKIVDTSRKNELLRNIIDTAMLDTEGVFGDFAIFDWGGYYESNPEYGEAMENAAWLNGDSISAVESAHVEAIEELDGGYRITAYGMDGGRYSAWVSKEMYRALVAVTNTSKLLGEGVNKLTRFGSKLTTPAKSMITGYNPNFAMRNVVRDLQTAFVNGISGVAFPKYYARALAQIKGNSEAWQQFKALGGTHFGYYGMSTDWAARMEKKPGTAAKVKDKLGAFSEITESATRFAEYLATIDKLGDTYEGRVQGIKNAAEVTVDFSRKGEYGKLANAWIPYWNPAVQGIDKLFRQIFDNSTSVKQKFAVSGVTLTRGAIVAVLPELLQYLLLKAADRYDDWEKLSDRTKDSYFCIPIAGEHKFFKIPKTREWGTLLGTPLMRMLEGFNGRSDPFENYVEDALLANFSVPGVGDAIGIGTLIDLWTNKDFAGRDIVPYAYQDAPASLQYDADTSVIAYGAATAWNKSFAKIAEALGMEVELSPMQLDYILNDYCGDFYYTLVEMVPVGLFDGSTSLKEVYNGILSSMKSTWVGDNRYSNYYTGEYYDILDYLDRSIAGEKLMNPEDYTNSYVFKLDKAFNEAYGKQLSELNKQAAQLPDGEEKDAIKEQIADLAFEAVEWFRNETINNSDDPFLRVSYGGFSDELQDALVGLDSFSSDYYFKPSPSTSKSYTDPHNKGKEYVLTEEQYAQYKTFYMEAYDEIMTQAVKSYQYKRLSDEEKAEYLDEARDAVHDKAKEELFAWLRRNGVKSTYKAD